MLWHTRNEKRILRSLNARPHHPGVDGILPNGRPVEIRECRSDNRFRIQQDVHRQMVANDGTYVFVNNGHTKKVPAKKVSDLMGNGSWFKDRKYPHKFVRKKQIF